MRSSTGVVPASERPTAGRSVRGMQSDRLGTCDSAALGRARSARATWPMTHDLRPVLTAPLRPSSPPPRERRTTPPVAFPVDPPSLRSARPRAGQAPWRLFPLDLFHRFSPNPGTQREKSLVQPESPTEAPGPEPYKAPTALRGGGSKGGLHEDQNARVRLVAKRVQPFTRREGLHSSC